MDPIDDKYKLAQSIREDYLNYSREEAYNLIKSGVFTEDELVNKFNLLTKRAFQHIINYPSRISETEDLPLCYEETVDNLISGNVDVLLFGVCGSGGKTCLMASLMSLIGESADFLYQEFDNDRECDNVYGQYLSNCLKSNRLPPFTPYQYYQVVNTLIKCKGHYKGVSFIEFEGQQVHVLCNQVYALDNTVDLMSCEHLNPSLIKTLNNKNKKIIFITIDPTKCQIEEPSKDNGYDYWVFNQLHVLDSVISLFNYSPTFMSNVIGLHTVVSKSDTWLKGCDSSSIDNAIRQLGVSNLLWGIERLRETYNITGSVEPIPFSIGRFMMGDTYEFDNSDAKKLLRLIMNDIEESEKCRSTLSRIMNFFNS